MMTYYLYIQRKGKLIGVSHKPNLQAVGAKRYLKMNVLSR